MVPLLKIDDVIQAKDMLRTFFHSFFPSPSFLPSFFPLLKKKKVPGAPGWLSQVMISQFMGSSPTSGSALTARSLEPASDSVSPSLSLCLLPAQALSLSLSKINIEKNGLEEHSMPDTR